MDKLLGMCQIFDCTLDELVQGDLTGREADPAKAVPETSCVTDICGYDEHSLQMAWMIPTGIAAIILGVAAFFLIQWMCSSSPVNLLYSLNTWDTLSIAAIFLGVIVGLAFFIPAGMGHTAFCKAHPYVEDFYTAEDKAHARSRFAFELIGGIAFIFAGILAGALADSTRFEMLGASLLMTCIAAGVWLIVNGGMYVGRTNLAEKDA